MELYSSKILCHRYKLVVEIHKVSAMNSLSQPSSQSRREHSLRSTLILGFTIRYVQVELRCSSKKSDYLFRILPTFYIWMLGKKKKKKKKKHFSITFGKCGNITAV